MQLVPLCLVLCSVIVVGYGIKCFQCSSVRDPGCADLGDLYAPDSPAKLTNASIDVLQYYRDCDDQNVTTENRNYFCRKMTQTIFDRDELELVIRSCGWELHPHLECYNFENKAHMETVCQCFEDGCNRAGSTVQYAPCLILASLAVALHRLYHTFP